MTRSHSRMISREKLSKMAPGQQIHCRFIQKVILLCFIASLLYFFVILPEYITGQESMVADAEVRPPREINQRQKPTQTTTASKQPPTKKKILAWTTLFKKDFLIYYKGKPINSDAAFSVCPIYKDCEWTIEKSAIDSADAVLFHFFPNDFSLKDLPSYRAPHQKWIHLNLESPLRFQDGKMSKVDGMFNVTATYEEDADISMPYGYYYKRTSPLKNYLPTGTNRTKSVVWMVSRCHTLSRREVYAEDLHQYIDIDIFGECGKPAPRKGSPPMNIDFRTELAKEYYFYLAFENSDCVDYITEKFWTTLLSGLVPIVRGQMPRYEKHAPPGSYINADAFFSYKDLADYLKYLIANPQEYNKYFQWRQWYSISTMGAFVNLDIHCKVCQFLHTRKDYHNVYNMSERYSSTSRCFNYHHNLAQIDFEVKRAYQDELEHFLAT